MPRVPIAEGLRPGAALGPPVLLGSSPLGSFALPVTKDVRRDVRGLEQHTASDANHWQPVGVTARERGETKHAARADAQDPRHVSGVEEGFDGRGHQSPSLIGRKSSTCPLWSLTIRTCIPGRSVILRSKPTREYRGAVNVRVALAASSSCSSMTGSATRTLRTTPSATGLMSRLLRTTITS